MRPLVRHVVSVLAGVAASFVIVVAVGASPGAGLTIEAAPTGPARTPSTGSAIPWAARYRSQLRRPGDRGHVRRMAVGIGAALAWELADLPRHRDPLPLMSGDSRPGALFAAPLMAGPHLADVPGGAIGAMIARWNELYPPYALDMDEKLPSGVAAAETNQSRSGPCQGN